MIYNVKNLRLSGRDSKLEDIYLYWKILSKSDKKEAQVFEKLELIDLKI